MGDADAFEVIFDRHIGVAFALAYRICGTRTSAEDTCQEAFMAAWRSAGGYDPERSSVRSWLLSIVHNRAIDQVRRATRHRNHTVSDDRAAEQVAGRADTAGEAIARQDRAATAGMLEALPQDQRRVIELSFYAGYSHSEIAELLGLPLGTVKGRMRIGLDRLRLQLRGEPA